jgi:hypothetical protein
MKYATIFTIAAFLSISILSSPLYAHGESKNVKLHVNPRWRECSFQIDPSLTQQAWRQFTKEAGLVTYFRPLTDAAPLGVGNYEFSILQWNTAFDDTKAAWNDTFVHPDSAHWLKEGDQLGIPGLSLRAAITSTIDVGAYWIKNPGANYGIWGGQLQYNIVHDRDNSWAASVRTGFAALYGPDDLNLAVYGLDVLVSKEFAVYSDWVTVSPYAGVSTYLTNAHETTAAVNLHDETIAGVQGMVGAVAQISFAKLALEYNVAAVNTYSFKIGFGF